MKVTRTLAVSLLMLPVILSLVAGCAGARAAGLLSLKPLIQVSGSGAALPVVQKLADAYIKNHPQVQFKFEPGTNSGGAIAGVVAGTINLGVINRPLTAPEATQPLVYTPLAQDAIVFVANDAVTMTQISHDTIRGIYSGRITNWSPVTGQNETILSLDRDPDEAIRKVAFLPLMNGTPVTERTIVLSQADAMVDSLKATPYSIGYSSLGLLKTKGAGNLNVLDLDGVTPEPASILSGAYPWSTVIGLVHSQHTFAALTDFVAFVKGAEGRAVLESYDYAAL